MAKQCGAKVWRCANCRNTIAGQYATDGTGCPKCPGAPIEESTCRKQVAEPRTRCNLHGAAAPQVRQAAANIMQRAKAERLVARLAIPPADENPVETLLTQLRLARGMVNMLAELVSELDGTIDTASGGAGIAGLTYHQSGIPTGEAKPHIYITMLRDWSADLNRLLVDCAKLGIEERRTQIAERIEANKLDQLKAALTRAMAVLPADSVEPFKRALAAELPREPPTLEG